MKRTHRILSGLLTGLMAIVPVMAEAQNVCLQRNRIVSWRPAGENRLVYMDRNMNEWTVTLRDRCRNLTNRNAILVYRNWSSLRCLSRNDIIRVTAAGFSMSTCRVESVQEGEPGAQTAGPG